MDVTEERRLVRDHPHAMTGGLTCLGDVPKDLDDRRR